MHYVMLNRHEAKLNPPTSINVHANSKFHQNPVMLKTEE